MRQDADVLLKRLGQNAFRYSEFGDPSEDADIWPIFEALLGDERVVGSGAPGVREVYAVPVTAQLVVEAPPVEVQRSDHAGASKGPGLFGNYERVSSPAASPEPSVRELLDRLAESA